MPIKDFFGPVKTLSATLTFSQKDVYNYLMRWYRDRNYDVDEKNYTEKILANGKKLYYFKWIVEKRIDDFTKCKMELYYTAEAENVQVETSDGKKKTMQQGEIAIKLGSYLDIDTEDEWSLNKRTPWMTLMREIYIKMAAKGTWARKKAHLIKDTNALISDINAYLKHFRYD
jgi:hypothetical protein